MANPKYATSEYEQNTEVRFDLYRITEGPFTVAAVIARFVPETTSLGEARSSQAFGQVAAAHEQPSLILPTPYETRHISRHSGRSEPTPTEPKWHEDDTLPDALNTVHERARSKSGVGGISPRFSDAITEEERLTIARYNPSPKTYDNEDGLHIGQYA